MVRFAALVLALCLFAGTARADGVGVARLVLVVGNDRPAETSQTALRYADDDAALLRRPR